jgi:multidrug efflux pump subunit AcrA (membrane-fusion protein)
MRLPRSPLAYLLALLAVVAIVVAVVLVGPPAAPQAQERLVSASRGVVQSTVSASGNLAPATQLDVDFQTSGTVTHIYVKEGERVAEDQVLARLDDRSAEVQLAQSRADYQEALDAVEQAGSTSTASATKGATMVYASATPEQAPSTGGGASSGGAPSSSGSSNGGGSTLSPEAAAANLESARLAVDEAERAVAATVLRAPASGTIAEITGAVGDTVSAGSSGSGGSSDSSDSDATSGGAQPDGGDGSAGGTGGSDSSSGSGFMTLATLDKLELQVSFSESDIGKLKVGQAATVSITALPDVKLAAKVVSIASLPDTSGNVVEYPVTLRLKQHDDQLKPGMTASAEVVVSQVDGAVTVPSAAIGPGDSVTVRADGKDETRRVTTGLVGDSTTEVVSGLKAGDEVVIESTPVTTGGAGGGAGGGLGGRGAFGGGGVGGGGPPGGGPPGGGGAVFRAGP